MFLLALFACTAPTPSRPPDLPPNVVVLLIDDAGFADFSMHGSPHFHTPSIDRLAAEGVRFGTAYTTAPICSPSRAALLTGRYQNRFGHEHNPAPVLGAASNGLSLSETLLPAYLREAGYRTAAFGKWHLGYHPHFHPLERGFEHFEGVLQGERSYFGRSERGFRRWMVGRDVVTPRFAYVTDRIGEAAAAFIREHRDEPFFLYVAFTAVHAPLEAQASDRSVQDEALTGPRRTLAAMTTALDRAIGTIDEALREAKLQEHTLVFLLNDNGAGPRNHGDNAPWRGGKGQLYEGGIRTPFVVRWTGAFSPGVRQDDLVSSLDVAATALAAAGVEPAKARPLDGLDLLPTLRGEEPLGRTHHVWRLGPSWAVREGRYKLIVHKGGEPQLFDLAVDPGETTDRAAAEPERVAELRAIYDRWEREMVPPAFPSNTELRRRRKRR